MKPGHEIKVLDHGYIKFVESMGTDETIIEAARMSTGRGFEGWDKDFKLLEFLWENQHATPFEMCELHLEVAAPIMVFREWHRHRTFSYNEFSARYSMMPNLHYVPDPERIQKQSKSNKQGSAESLPLDEAETICKVFRTEQDLVFKSYEDMIGLGVAKEIARLNTPVSRYSKMRAKTDLRNWLAFLKLRMAPNAQWEIRQYANAVAEIIKELWPRTWGLFVEHTLMSSTFSYMELQALRMIIQTGSTTQANKDVFAGDDRKMQKLLAKVGL